MSRRFVVAGVVVAALAPGCKKKAREDAPPPPTPVATAASPDAGGLPPATAPDPDYERRREELLRRGDPAMMKSAPLVDDSAPAPNPADLIKPVGKDVMMVGAIKVDLARGTAEIPAAFAAPTSPLEYVAVAEQGKAYESLLTVAAAPVELRLALTLLGYEGTPPGADGTVPRATPTDSVEVSLVVDGKPRPLGDFMIDQKTGKAPPEVPWQVVGFADANRASALRSKDYLTLVERDVLAPMRRSVDAGNPYAQGQGLIANSKTIPVVGTKVTLVIARGPGGPAPKAPSPAAPSPSSTP